MSFTFGNSTIGDAYFGAIKIGSAYQGSTLVYQSHKPATRVAFTSGTCSKQNYSVRS